MQVIAQQWEFTYRYPTFGGIETAQLELPVDRQIEFHVTSLDVIHSFWAPKLGVKADANPGVDNIAYTEPTKEQDFEVHCSELCGLWHGYMFRHRQGRQQRRVPRLDPPPAAGLRARRQEPSAVRDALLPRT